MQRRDPSIVSLPGPNPPAQKLFDATSCTTLARACMYIFVPSLTFGKLSQSVTLDSVLYLWPLLANLVLRCVGGVGGGGGDGGGWVSRGTRACTHARVIGRVQRCTCASVDPSGGACSECDLGGHVGRRISAWHSQASGARGGSPLLQRLPSPPSPPLSSPHALSTARSVAVGAALGWALGPLLRVPRQLRPHVMCAVAFGNVGNLPLVFVSALCRDPHTIFHRELGASCESVGMSYIAFSILGATVLQFTLGIWLLKPRPELVCLDDGEPGSPDPAPGLPPDALQQPPRLLSSGLTPSLRAPDRGGYLPVAGGEEGAGSGMLPGLIAGHAGGDRPAGTSTVVGDPRSRRDSKTRHADGAASPAGVPRQDQAHVLLPARHGGRAKLARAGGSGDLADGDGALIPTCPSLDGSPVGGGEEPQPLSKDSELHSWPSGMRGWSFMRGHPRAPPPADLELSQRWSALDGTASEAALSDPEHAVLSRDSSRLLPLVHRSGSGAAPARTADSRLRRWLCRAGCCCAATPPALARNLVACMLCPLRYACSVPLPAHAALFGVVVGCTVPLRTALHSPDGVLRVFADTLQTLAGGLIPTAIVLLGAVLFRRARAGRGGHTAAAALHLGVW